MKSALSKPGQDRVTVSLSPGRLQEVKDRVARGEAPSVSAYMEQLLARNEQTITLWQLLDDMDRDYGPPSAEDEAWAREVLAT
ncbi:MAG: toxin-antitoxin system antitoxin subunit [Candidatus Dormibacteria bacterium]